MLKPSSGLVAASALLVLGLSGCGREADQASRRLADDRAPSERPARVERASRDYQDDRPGAGGRDAASVRRQDASDLAWASSRRGSADDNARRQFERNGADFGAATLDAYVRKAAAFAAAPPTGALAAQRANGDRILYDPKSNTFLAVDRSGLPRTMFKPREGRAYWDEQQQRLAQSSGRSRTPRRGSGDGPGREDARG